MRTPIMFSPGNAAIEEAVRASLFEAVLDILGTGGTVAPLGDSKHGALTGTTLATVGDEQVTYTLSDAASFSVMDTVPGKKSLVPILDWNGSDEYVNTLDDSAWDGGNGSTDNAIIVGCWIKPDSVSGGGYLFSKFAPAATGDWALDIASSGPRFSVRDPSASKNARMQCDTDLVDGVWVFVVVTYDGTGGSNALADPNCQIYIDGAKKSSTYDDDVGGYVAMEGSTNTLDIGADNGDDFYDGKMAGGSLGPFFVKSELSADAILRLYEVGRRALNL
jgi:hypothetical protein